MATTQTAQAKARICAVQTAQAKTRIFGFVTASCEVDFNVLPTITQICVVAFNVSDKVASYRTSQSKARILQTTTAAMSVSFTVNYSMPANILRPTERTVFS